MRFSGYIFDVDGTLVDSVSPSVTSLQAAFAEVGFEVTYETLQSYVGLDVEQIIEILAPELDVRARQHVLTCRATIYREVFLGGIEPIRARDLFETIKKAGGRIALATDCKGPELHRYLEVLGVEDMIDALACGDDVEHGKPDPRLIGAALRKLGLPAKDVLMIGDTPYDAEAAQEAGLAAAGVMTGGFSKEALLQAGCLTVAREVSDLAAWLFTDKRRPSEAAE